MAAVFWGVAVGMVLVVWVMALTGAPWRLTIGAVVTTVLSVNVAAVWQGRCFVSRVCALLRMSGGLQGPDAELYALTGERPR